MCQNGSFSPHHCVGFLFFAWIPPLLFPLLHPTTHHTTTHHSSTSHNSTSHRNSSQLPFMWQAQYTELPGCLSCGRRSTHSFLNKLRRAWPPLARGCLSCHSSHTTHHCTTSHISLITPLITTPLLTSHSSHHACGRRSTQSLLARGCPTHHYTTSHISLITPCVWQVQYTEPPGPRLPFVWQAQYTELPGCLSCGRRNTQSFLDKLRRAWPPLARGCLSCHSSHTTHHCTMHLSHLTHRTTRVAGAVHRASWRSCVVWQAQYAEPWPLLARGCLSWHEAAAGPRLPFVWQAQYTQLPGQAAARVAAAGPRLPSCHSSHTHSPLHHFSHLTHQDPTHHYTSAHILTHDTTRVAGAV